MHALKIKIPRFKSFASRPKVANICSEDDTPSYVQQFYISALQGMKILARRSIVESRGQTSESQLLKLSVTESGVWAFAGGAVSGKRG